VLLQAQPKSQTKDTLTVEVLHQSLADDFRVPDEQVAVVTGAPRKLAGVDLFSHDCPIRFIVMQKALSEGWDCSFAYVLCSGGELKVSGTVSRTALGRTIP
jgi:type III restriction enzyme